MDLLLVFLSGTHKGQRPEFRGPRRLVVGRSPKADVPVLDEKVSRKHCEIILAKNAVHVEDLGSANGTFVNGARIAVEKLKAGDRLRIAETETSVALFTNEERT